MADKVFVSPGVYTSEKDLTYVTRQVGVTTLGLVGETTKGPAFQPIFVSNYDEFVAFFGGLNNKLVDGPDGNNAPQYELPYIAKSYLTQSNQLYVTRILGLSGYDGGLAWGIKLRAGLDTSTTAATSSIVNSTPYLTYTATTGNSGALVAISTSVPLISALYSEGLLDLSQLANSPIATLIEFGALFTKLGDNSFSGASGGVKVINTGYTGAYLTGTTSGFTFYYSGSAYAEVENKVVALLRSRGTVNSTTQVPEFQVENTGDLIISPNVTEASYNPLGTFVLSGVSQTQGAFTYNVSLDSTQRNYLPKVLGRTPTDSKTAVFAEEVFGNMFDDYNAEGKIYGISLSIVGYGNAFYDYLTEYKPAVTPYVVSELKGNTLLKLFRFVTISDGNAANEQFKISITNIKPDSKEFDVVVRAYDDKDDALNVYEVYGRCVLDPANPNFIAKKIGTVDGTYASKSRFVLVELNNDVDISDSFPAGFLGYPIRDYQSAPNTGVTSPSIAYKTAYSTSDNKRKVYLGVSDTVGIDSDFFDYKGVPSGKVYEIWTGLTKGFHMDIDASGAVVDQAAIVMNATGGTYTPSYEFDAGDWEFRTNVGLEGGPYEKVYARKFTLVPYGGFDGWDSYRTRRTNLDGFTVNGTKGAAGLNAGTFANRTLSNGDIGINSDYYAYLEGIWTFRNPADTNINVFATPGVEIFDNSSLVEATIDMVEIDRADCVYIVTTPDVDASGNLLDIGDVAFDIAQLVDSSYTATYWPWIQVFDDENGVYVYMPPTRDVVRNIALTDNIAFPWFAVAGIQRGDVSANKARKKLTLNERDDLYENRINPIATFASDGIKIWGNKTLQQKESPLDRLNVRRLLIQARKLISAVAIRLLFEQNDNVVRNQFLSLVNPILENIRTERGLTDFRIVLNNDPEDIDKQQLTGKIFLKPTKALEYIIVEFNIMNTGASFDNI